MTKLHQLIQQYGQPDILIDHWDESSRGYAIWGIDEEFQIEQNDIAIINGERIHGSAMQIWQNTLDRWKQDKTELTAVGYISYDIKNLLFPDITFKKTKKRETKS